MSLAMSTAQPLSEFTYSEVISKSPINLNEHLIVSKLVVSWISKLKCVLHEGFICQVNPGFIYREGSEYITMVILHNRRNRHKMLK